MCVLGEWCWTFKSCLGYCCLSVTGDGDRSLPSDSPLSLPLLAWERTPGHSECLNVLFIISPVCSTSLCLFFLNQTLELAFGENKSSTARAFQVLIKLTQRPEFNYTEEPVNFQLHCWKRVSVVFGPGLVSVCVTRATVFKNNNNNKNKQKVTREQHLSGTTGMRRK